MPKAKYTQRSDGRYHTTVWDGSYNEDGTKHRIHLYSTKSSLDLERKVNEIRTNVKTGKYTVNESITFIEYSRKWLKSYKAVRSRNTQYMYENIIEKHLIILEGIKVSDIRRYHLQTVINESRDRPRTCQQINVTFRQIIRAAISDKLLAANAVSDICSDIDAPRYIPTEKRALLPEEIEAISKAAFSARERAFVYIIYGCGLRRGEALALTRFDVDLKTSILTVNKALAFDVNQSYVKSTKSENGVRNVHIPPFVNEYLQQYIRTLKGTNLIAKNDGEPMTKSSYDKMWASIVKKMNTAAGGTDKVKVIYGLTAHVFRHNYCTNLCYEVPKGKISFKKIAYLMGDTEKMVHDVYSHILEQKEHSEEVINSVIAL